MSQDCPLCLGAFSSQLDCILSHYYWFGMLGWQWNPVNLDLDTIMCVVSLDHVLLGRNQSILEILHYFGVHEQKCIQI